MRMILAAAAALASAGCVSVDVHDVTAGDVALSAVQNARPRNCPAGRTQANARNGSDVQSVGVEGIDIAFTPVASDPTRAVRLRRLTIQPGGIVAWHSHDVVQGMAILLSGEMTEYRNDCLDAIVHHPGDVAREDANTSHGWRNLSDRTAVVLVSHIVPRPQE